MILYVLYEVILYINQNIEGAYIHLYNFHVSVTSRRTHEQLDFSKLCCNSQIMDHWFFQNIVHTKLPLLCMKFQQKSELFIHPSLLFNLSLLYRKSFITFSLTVRSWWFRIFHRVVFVCETYAIQIKTYTFCTKVCFYVF